MVKFLIENDADIRATDNFGKTPREIALKHGYQNVARILRQTEELNINKPQID